MNIAQVKVNVTVNEVTRDIPLVMLLAWKGALRLETVGLRHSKQNASTIIRRTFNLPRTFKTAALLEMVTGMLADVDAQMAAQAQ